MKYIVHGSKNKNDSKFTYFRASFLKRMRRFDLLLQVLITYWWWPVEAGRNVEHVSKFCSKVSKLNIIFYSWSREQYISHIHCGCKLCTCHKEDDDRGRERTRVSTPHRHIRLKQLKHMSTK